MTNEHSKSNKVIYPVLWTSQEPHVPGPDKFSSGVASLQTNHSRYNSCGFLSYYSQIHLKVTTSSPGLLDIEWEAGNYGESVTKSPFHNKLKVPSSLHVVAPFWNYQCLHSIKNNRQWGAENTVLLHLFVRHVFIWLPDICID